MATKNEIIEKLEELEIEHDPRAKKDELFDLLPVEAQEELEGDEEGEEEGEAENEENADKGATPKASAKVEVKTGVARPGKDDKEVDVVAPDGSWIPGVSRTYSEKGHGKNFFKLAESYVKAREKKHRQHVVVAKHRSR